MSLVHHFGGSGHLGQRTVCAMEPAEDPVPSAPSHGLFQDPSLSMSWEMVEAQIQELFTAQFAKFMPSQTAPHPPAAPTSALP